MNAPLVKESRGGALRFRGGKIQGEEEAARV